MPELPEVETVRRGLAPYLEGARIEAVRLNRADLRFALPASLPAELAGQVVDSVGRRAKYLLFRLSGGKTLLSHLGMTGSYRFADFAYKDPSRYYEPSQNEKHDHLVFELNHPVHGRLRLIYNDARRFGFIDLFAREEDCPYLAGLGPEPLGNDFNAAGLAQRLRGRTAPLKAVLLDQRVVAGIGNIYASEALWRAHLHPELAAGRLVRKDGAPGRRLDDLVHGVRAVLIEAVEAGGSTLRDFRAADGGPGYFQHHFAVYDRAGEPCPTPGCSGVIRRIVQSGRSSFFCPVCQKR
ncbi:bifunctional DNA-formamidopyrimidine glycosylase/DNA-(apurinic or apyrimidinic site) lyase [Devosia sp.]|uniref:bifunctional DNA-formamidopyrimidine glycosylase/DNA-(apurinic or apyrimidinic site) lyase n=1 Tax=Devosia sp. TaxID=1871048 RepID=UPI002F0DCAEF